MKRKQLSFILCIAILFSLIPRLTVRADLASTEFELACRIIDNCLADEYEKEVGHTGGFEDNRLAVMVASVVPEKIYFHSNWLTYPDGSTTDFVSYAVNIDAAAARAKEEAKRVAGELVRDGMSTPEKIKAFNDYIAKNCEYDYQAAEEGMNETNIASYSLSGVFFNRKAVCDGYAAAMTALCQAAGIPCFKISSSKMNHAWNMIYDGEEWSFTDVTNNSMNNGEATDTYLMLSPEELIQLGYQFDESGRDTLSLTQYGEFIQYYMNRKGTGTGEIRFKTPQYQKDLAGVLYENGLLKGTEYGLELGRRFRRNEMAAMFTRVLGAEKMALIQKIPSPFSDMSWASDYIGYLVEQKLIRGIGGNLFGGDNYTSLKDYATVLLRVLGYSEEAGDFSWDQSVRKAKEIGVLTETIEKTEEFDRGTMSEMTFRALYCTYRKGTSQTLNSYLSEQGALDPEVSKAVYQKYRAGIDDYLNNIQ